MPLEDCRSTGACRPAAPPMRPGHGQHGLDSRPAGWRQRCLGTNAGGMDRRRQKRAMVTGGPLLITDHHRAPKLASRPAKPPSRQRPPGGVAQSKREPPHQIQQPKQRTGQAAADQARPVACPPASGSSSGLAVSARANLCQQGIIAHHPPHPSCPTASPATPTSPARAGRRRRNSPPPCGAGRQDRGCDPAASAPDQIHDSPSQRFHHEDKNDKREDTPDASGDDKQWPADGAFRQPAFLAAAGEEEEWRSPILFHRVHAVPSHAP